MCRNQNSASPIWSEICWFQNIPPSGSLLTPSMAPPLVGSIVAHLDQISPLCPGPPVPTLVPHSLSSPQQPPERGLQGSHRSQDKKPKSSLQPAPSAPRPHLPLTHCSRPPCCSSNTTGTVLSQDLCTCWLPLPGMLFPQIFSQLLLILPKHHLLR